MPKAGLKHANGPKIKVLRPPSSFGGNPAAFSHCTVALINLVLRTVFATDKRLAAEGARSAKARNVSNRSAVGVLLARTYHWLFASPCLLVRHTFGNQAILGLPGVCAAAPGHGYDRQRTSYRTDELTDQPDELCAAEHGPRASSSRCCVGPAILRLGDAASRPSRSAEPTARVGCILS